jgi:hypothetical protein
MISASTPYDIRIESVLVSAERFGGHTFQISASVIEINIYEHIDLAYLTGTILITDSGNMMNLIQFRGSERIVTKVKIHGDESALPVTKTFIVKSVIRAAASGDTSQTIELHVIEEHAYRNDFTLTSEVYKGSGEDIISAILYDQLGKESVTPKSLNEFPEWGGSNQTGMKYVVPNIRPLDAVREIKNKITNHNGMPFFVYSTFYDDNIVITELEQIMSKIIGRDFWPYVYDQSRIRKFIEESVPAQAFGIEGYSMKNLNDQTKLAKGGHFNSSYTHFNINQNPAIDQSLTYDLKIGEVFDDMVNKNIIKYSQKAKPFDDEVVFGNEPMIDVGGTVSGMIADRQFIGYNSIHEDTQAGARLRETSSMVRHMLVKSPIDILVPGWNFLGREVHKTIGNTITAKFLKNDPDVTELDYADSRIDQVRSGEYIIYAARHIISLNQYKIALTCTKLANYE